MLRPDGIHAGGQGRGERNALDVVADVLREREPDAAVFGQKIAVVGHAQMHHAGIGRVLGQTVQHGGFYAVHRQPPVLARVAGLVDREPVGEEPVGRVARVNGDAAQGGPEVASARAEPGLAVIVLLQPLPLDLLPAALAAFERRRTCLWWRR